MNPWLAASAIVAAVTFGVHLFAGGVDVVRPLLTSETLCREPKETLYFVWHMVSLELAVLALALGYCAAYDPGNQPLVFAMAGLAGGSGGLSIGLTIWRRIPPTLLMQWVLLIPIAVLAIVGIAR
ncbi:MAG: hypothetical protein ACRC8S_18805 [Fimbriiglobus sp.]